jgi:precorrin-2/cobalt-factor-2 C20-methyltransferase
MTKDETVLEKARNENARLLSESLSLGDVAFISIGDILFYSTFGNLLTGLKKVLPSLRVSVVPGVTSFNGAAARIVEPLVQGSESFAVIPATYEASHLERMIDLHETVVFMKINRVIPSLLRMLEERGLLSNCIYLEHVETSRELVVRDVGSLLGREVPYMSLLILRKNGWGEHGKTS